MYAISTIITYFRRLICRLTYHIRLEQNYHPNEYLNVYHVLCFALYASMLVRLHKQSDIVKNTFASDC